MRYNQLGNSELRISEIGYGCMSLGDDTNTNTKLLHEAYDKGVNFFDTADLYQKSENEVYVGKALKDRRDKVIIATKVGNQWKDDFSAWDWNPRKEYILKAIDKSLQRLQTDYIDLYQLHGGTIEDPIDETIEAFEELKAIGKIRAYGISSIRPNVIREYVKKSNICSVMMQYSILDRRPEMVFDLLEQNNIGVLARGSLCKGLLLGKTPTPYLNHTEQEVEIAAKLIQGISNEETPKAQTALGFPLYQPIIKSAVTGMSSLQQVNEILDVPRKHISQEIHNTITDNIQLFQYDKHI